MTMPTDLPRRCVLCGHRFAPSSSASSSPSSAAAARCSECGHDHSDSRAELRRSLRSCAVVIATAIVPHVVVFTGAYLYTPAFAWIGFWVFALPVAILKLVVLLVTAPRIRIRCRSRHAWAHLSTAVLAPALGLGAYYLLCCLFWGPIAADLQLRA